MCCIFTCCGWMLDMIQRVWVFVMSCCISTAVCCVLITSSLSGVALGYNYSLAEYIDLKETNVSVFIKRGVFDDEVVDDMMDVRRKGPALRTLQDDGNLKLPSEESDSEQMPVDSGRRLDNSIVASNDRNIFEGSLMKMTMKPPDHIVDTTVADDLIFGSVMVSMTPPGGSLDQLKAIQGIINMRKSAAARDPNDIKDSVQKTGKDGPDLKGLQNVPYGMPEHQYRRMMAEQLSNPGARLQSREQNELRPPIAGLPSLYNNPEFEHLRNALPQGKPPDESRRMMSAMAGSHIPEMRTFPKINDARYAVPSGRMSDDWNVPNLPPEVYRRVFHKDKDDIYDDQPGLPKPVTYSTGPVRPTTVRTTLELLPTRSTMYPPREDTYATKEASLETSESSPRIVGPENIDYYEDDVKGLPVRRRRSIKKTAKNIIKTITYTPSNSNYRQSNSSPFSVFKLQHNITRTKPDYYKLSNNISSKVTDDLNTPLIKLHFLDSILSNETSSTNEIEVRNGIKAARLTVNNGHPIRSFFGL